MFEGDIKKDEMEYSAIVKKLFDNTLLISRPRGIKILNMSLFNSLFHGMAIFYEIGSEFRQYCLEKKNHSFIATLVAIMNIEDKVERNEMWINFLRSLQTVGCFVSSDRKIGLNGIISDVFVEMMSGTCSFELAYICSCGHIENHLIKKNKMHN